MNIQKFRETVAALCHEQWSGWMLYMIGKSQKKSDGSVVIPSALVERWMRQMTTAYNNLPENEKESDRDEADRFIKLFSENQAITEIAALADIREALGVGSEPMLADLPVIARKIKRDADRYKLVRELTPTEFSTLHLRIFKNKGLFDEFVDEIIRSQKHAQSVASSDSGKEKRLD